MSYDLLALKSNWFSVLARRTGTVGLRETNKHITNISTNNKQTYYKYINKQ